MTPKGGGDPLEPSPICLGAHTHPLEHDRAKAYVAKIREALDDEKRYWTPGQRIALRDLLAKWKLRALGGDDHFEKFGTFRRHPTSDPPTESDRVMERWRREAMAKPGYKTAKEQYQESHVPLGVRMRHKIEAQWRKDHGTKGDGIIDKTKSDLWDD